MKNVELLLKIGRVTHYTKNQMLFLQNDPGDNMYIALKGSFGVYLNSFTDFPMRVAGIQPGLFFGEMSVIDSWPRSATIISEEESTALAIEKDKFEQFLEGCPDMAQAMLKMLGSRADSTADMARKTGKMIPDLPSYLKDPEFSDPKTNHTNMLMLAQRIRELNDLLGLNAATAPIEMKKTSGITTLLPTGYKPVNKSDNADNSKILAVKKYTCPYCRKSFSGRIPLFSRLKEKGKTFDQRIIYKNFNLLLYTNIVCPNCNYCDTYQEFTVIQGTELNIAKINGNQFINAEGFTGFSDEMRHTFDEAFLSYYQNLMCLEQVPDSALRKAKAWQRLHWLYNDCGEWEQAEQAAVHAKGYYKEYLAGHGSTLSVIDRLTVNTILGEMCVAAGNVQEGCEYFAENIRIGKTTSHDLVDISKQRADELSNM